MPFIKDFGGGASPRRFVKNHKLCNRIIPLKLLLLIGVKIAETEQAFSLSDEQEITGKLQTNHS